MKVYIAGITAERQYIQSYETWRSITKRPGDVMYLQHGARGDVARTIVCDKFLEDKRYDALMLCDLDQKFPKDALEKLRAHDKDMVSGHYMKRTTRNMTSIWQYSLDQEWPYIPFIDPPDTGMWDLATTGMGCVLIKREVIEAVDSLLPPGSSPFEIGKIPEIAIPQANFGSDYRFFYLAKRLGYKLFGDASIDLPHASTLWITRKTISMLEQQRRNAIENLSELVFINSIKARGMISKNAVMSRIVQLREALEGVHEPTQHAIVSGQIEECEFWLTSLNESAPDAVSTELWKEIYKGGYSSKRENNKSGFKLPVFNSKQEAIDAMANRGKAIENTNEEDARKHRVKARREQSMAAATRMKSLVTSSGHGELEVLE